MFSCKCHIDLLNLTGFGLLVLLSSQPLQAQLDDPTLPPNVTNVVNDAKVTATTWDLSSILVSPHRSVAIINGKSVQTGELLAGARVLSISETAVKLRHRGEIILLELFPADVKKLHEAQK